MCARARERERERERDGGEVWRSWRGSFVSALSSFSMTMAECKPRGPCSGCACESEEAVAKKREELEDEALLVKKREEEEEQQQQEEDVSAAAVDGVVDVERLLQELVDLTRSLLAEVT